MKHGRMVCTGKMALIAVMSLLLILLGTGCDWMRSNVSHYEHDEEISIPAGTYTTLVVENRAGTIRVRSTTGDRVTGLLRKKASGSGAATLKDVVGSVTYQVQTAGETIMITEVYRTDDRVDFWSWKDSNHPNVNVGLEYELSVPAGIQVIEIRQAAGNTDIDQFGGTVFVANNAGNVTLSRVQLAGDSRIALVSGNLDIGIQEIAADATLVSELTAGNVTLTMPKNIHTEVNASVDAGTISGNLDSLPVTNSSVTQILGDGGTHVSVLVASGNIVIKQE